MNQGRRFTTNGTTATLTCHCTTAEHGMVVLDLDPWSDDSTEICYIQFIGTIRAINLWQRLKQAWRALQGKHVETDFMIGRDDMRKMGKWLIDNSNEAVLEEIAREQWKKS